MLEGEKQDLRRDWSMKERGETKENKIFSGAHQRVLGKIDFNLWRVVQSFRES